MMMMNLIMMLLSGVLLPKPIAECRYYHRSLNPRKLVEVGFSGALGRNMTMSRLVKLNKLPSKHVMNNIRPMEEKDVVDVQQLLSDHLTKYKVHQHFSVDEVRHGFLRPDVVYSYVKANDDEKVTDFFAFYSLTSSVLNNNKHNKLYAAYFFYAVPATVELEALITEMLICANMKGFDVFNALDYMDNRGLMSRLRFGTGDGFLHYYLYNWMIDTVKSEEIGVTLV